jgi:hypothetical protein
MRYHPWRGVRARSRPPLEQRKFLGNRTRTAGAGEAYPQRPSQDATMLGALEAVAEPVGEALCGVARSLGGTRAFAFEDEVPEFRGRESA